MNMKKWILWLCFLLLLGAASAEGADGFWTSNVDVNYHLCECCGGVQGRVPISEEAAQAFAKLACPICIPAEDSGEDVQAVSRGGTIVVRFSDAWLNTHELTNVLAWSTDDTYEGSQAWQMLGEYLHGADYCAFAEAYLEKGRAEGRSNTPYILSDQAMVMSRRHIGSSWYIVVRPQKKFRNDWSMYWRVSSLNLHMENDVLTSRFDLQTIEENRELALERLDEIDIRFSGDYEGFSMEVYDALDGHVAVIREESAQTDHLEDAKLMIEGMTASVDLLGYAEGRDGVYCCMLTDAELDALMNRAQAQLWHEEALLDGRLYRVDMGDHYDVYAQAEEQKIAAVEKISGSDPMDYAYRISADQPERFVLYRQDHAALCDCDGQFYTVQDREGHAAERLTPLLWQNGHGVYLAEYHKYRDYGPEDRLFAENGVEYGQRIGSAPQDEWGSYLCWLADENGNALSNTDNQAFTILENDGVQLETLTGNTALYSLFSD